MAGRNVNTGALGVTVFTGVMASLTAAFNSQADKALIFLSITMMLFVLLLALRRMNEGREVIWRFIHVVISSIFFLFVVIILFLITGAIAGYFPAVRQLLGYQVAAPLPDLPPFSKTYFNDSLTIRWPAQNIASHILVFNIDRKGSNTSFPRVIRVPASEEVAVIPLGGNGDFRILIHSELGDRLSPTSAVNFSKGTPAIIGGITGLYTGFLESGSAHDNMGFLSIYNQQTRSEFEISGQFVAGHLSGPSSIAMTRRGNEPFREFRCDTIFTESQISAGQCRITFLPSRESCEIYRADSPGTEVNFTQSLNSIYEGGIARSFGTFADPYPPFPCATLSRRMRFIVGPFLLTPNGLGSLSSHSFIIQGDWQDGFLSGPNNARIHIARGQTAGEEFGRFDRGVLVDGFFFNRPGELTESFRVLNSTPRNGSYFRSNEIFDEFGVAEPGVTLRQRFSVRRVFDQSESAHPPLSFSGRLAISIDNGDTAPYYAQVNEGESCLRQILPDAMLARSRASEWGIVCGTMLNDFDEETRGREPQTRMCVVHHAAGVRIAVALEGAAPNQSLRRFLNVGNEGRKETIEISGQNFDEPDQNRPPRAGQFFRQATRYRHRADMIIANLCSAGGATLHPSGNRVSASGFCELMLEAMARVAACRLPSN